jgi:hypothetical protein
VPSQVWPRRLIAEAEQQIAEKLERHREEDVMFFVLDILGVKKSYGKWCSYSSLE